MPKVKAKSKTKTNGVPLPKKLRKSLQELMEEQGVVGKSRLENLLGQGADLWESDEDFDKFLKSIYDMRRLDQEMQIGNVEIKV